MKTETANGDLRAGMLRYLFALVLVAVIVALTVAASPLLGPGGPLLLLLVPPLVATGYGGPGPGLLAAVLSSAAVFHFLPLYEDGRLAPTGAAAAAFGIENLVLMGGTSALRAARLRAEASAKRLAAAHAVSSALSNARSVREVTEAILHEGVAALGAIGAAVYLLQDPGGPLRLVARLSPDQRRSDGLKEIPLDVDFPIGLAAQTGQAIFFESLADLDRRCPRLLPDRRGALHPAGFYAPMIVHGRVIGILGVGFAKTRRFDAQERFWVQTLARDCGMAVERSRLFEAEQRARLDAEEANRAKDDFLGVASHELRAPLTSIVGWAHLLKKTPIEDGARHARGLDAIERSALAQARLVDDLLDVSRIAAGKLKIDAKPLRLAPLVRSCVEDVRGAATARGLTLEIGVEADAVLVGDFDRLRQVFGNLLSNALKFTPRGGHVHVETAITEGKCIVRVCDDGKGIPSGEIEHVFEPFHQVDSNAARREGGLGLGLAIVRYIVREHGGSVRVDSPGVGRGTTAMVELPVAEHLSGLVPVASVQNVANDAGALGGLRVLVVEDDADTREAVAEMLVARGAQVKRVPTAKAALVEVSKFLPNAIVSDIAMPDEDGYWLMRKLRTLPSGVATIPALALTAYSRPEDVRAAIAAGFQQHIVKPPEPRALADAVARLCAQAD
jgi:signal transduction histidine kinase